jgi:drug/metabolite transporter (DMT)-like permease
MKMRTLLTVLGIVLVIAGIVFIGQGSGYFPYPAESFMISQTRWVFYGAAIAVAGALILIFAVRR